MDSACIRLQVTAMGSKLFDLVSGQSLRQVCTLHRVHQFLRQVRQIHYITSCISLSDRYVKYITLHLVCISLSDRYVKYITSFCMQLAIMMSCACFNEYQSMYAIVNYVQDCNHRHMQMYPLSGRNHRFPMLQCLCLRVYDMIRYNSCVSYSCACV
jgi:hypothetical protein